MEIENWSEKSKIFLRDYFLEAGKHLNALIDYCDNCHSLKEKTISEKIMYLLSEGKLRISRSTGQTRLDKRMSGFHFAESSFMGGRTVLEGEAEPFGIVVKYFPSFIRKRNGERNAEKYLTLKEWNALTKKLCKLTMEWKEEYYDPNIMDGLQWSLCLTFESGEKVRYSGSNSFPLNWDSFYRFMRKIKKDLK